MQMMIDEPEIPTTRPMLVWPERLVCPARLKYVAEPEQPQILAPPQFLKLALHFPNEVELLVCDDKVISPPFEESLLEIIVLVPSEVQDIVELPD